MSLTNLKDNKPAPILHGENFLRPVSSLPDGKRTATKLYIVGHSETGHNHVIESKKCDMQVIEDGARRYLLVEEVSALFHQKTFDIHETVEVQPGMYEITHKTEYDPWQGVIRAVYD